MLIAGEVGWSEVCVRGRVGLASRACRSRHRSRSVLSSQMRTCCVKGCGVPTTSRAVPPPSDEHMRSLLLKACVPDASTVPQRARELLALLRYHAGREHGKRVMDAIGGMTEEQLRAAGPERFAWLSLAGFSLEEIKGRWLGLDMICASHFDSSPRRRSLPSVNLPGDTDACDIRAAGLSASAERQAKRLRKAEEVAFREVCESILARLQEEVIDACSGRPHLATIALDAIAPFLATRLESCLLFGASPAPNFVGPIIDFLVRVVAQTPPTDPSCIRAIQRLQESTHAVGLLRSDRLQAVALSAPQWRALFGFSCFRNIAELVDVLDKLAPWAHIPLFRSRQSFHEQAQRRLSNPHGVPDTSRRLLGAVDATLLVLFVLRTGMPLVTTLDGYLSRVRYNVVCQQHPLWGQHRDGAEILLCDFGVAFREPPTVP